MVGSPWVTALAKIGGPGILGGMLCKWLEPMKAPDIYNLAVEYKDKDVWEVIPPDWKEKIKNYQNNINILDQLSVEWAVDELIKGKRADLASLILNTPEVAEFIDKIINDLQKGARGEK